MIDVCAFTLCKSAYEERFVALTEQNHGPVAFGFSLTRAGGSLLDDLAAEVRVDLAFLGTGNCVKQGLVVDAFLPAEPPKPSGLENPHRLHYSTGCYSLHDCNSLQGSSRTDMYPQGLDSAQAHRVGPNRRMRLFRNTRFEILTPFSPEECVERLRAALVTPDKDGTLTVDGTFFAKRVWLSKRIWYRNSFQTFLVVSLHPLGQGSLIRVSMGVHVVVWAFLAIWYGGIFTAAIARLQFGDLNGMGVLFGVSLVGVVALWVGRILARDEGPFLKNFVVRALNAKELVADKEPSHHSN